MKQLLQSLNVCSFLKNFLHRDVYIALTVLQENITRCSVQKYLSHFNFSEPCNVAWQVSSSFKLKSITIFSKVHMIC